jgi:hypothetical protein
VPKISDRIAALKSRKEQLASKLTRLEAKDRADKRKLDTRRQIIVGAAVIAQFEKDPAFARIVARVFSTSVERQQDRVAIADLLTPPP